MSSDVQVTWISVVLFCTSDIEGRWIDSLILLILHLFCQASAFSSSHSFLVRSLSNLSSHSGTVGSVFGPVTDGNTWKLTCYMELSSSPPTPPKKQVSARMSGVLFSLMTRPYNWQHQVSYCVEVAYHRVCCCQHLPRWVSRALVASGRCYWEGEVVPLKVPAMYLRFRLQKHWDHKRLKHTKTMLEKILQLQG